MVEISHIPHTVIGHVFYNFTRPRLENTTKCLLLHQFNDPSNRTKLSIRPLVSSYYYYNTFLTNVYSFVYLSPIPLHPTCFDGLQTSRKFIYHHQQQLWRETRILTIQSRIVLQKSTAVRAQVILIVTANKRKGNEMINDHRSSIDFLDGGRHDLSNLKKKSKVGQNDHEQ